MHTEVKELADGSLEITVGERVITLSRDEAEAVHFHLMEYMRPETAEEMTQRHAAFLARLRGANRTGVQALLRAGTHDDILVLLRLAEGDERLTRKLYGNMTENAIKLYVEDLVFKYKQGVPRHLADAALGRLETAVDALVANGTLKFETQKTD
jgi:hypothetical protein